MGVCDLVITTVDHRLSQCAGEQSTRVDDAMLENAELRLLQTIRTA